MSVSGRNWARRGWRAIGDVPITVAMVVGTSWLFLWGGVTDTALAVRPVTFLNPLWYAISMVVHDGWGHFAGNMVLFVPFGVVLTWLTSNRHVAVVIAVAHGLSNFVWVATVFGPAIGTSGAALGVMAAALVRSTGVGLQHFSTETRFVAVVGLLAPLLAGLFVIAVAAGASPIAHFAHVFAFLFGGATEAMYVLSTPDTSDRSIPVDVGR
ncbi:MAG: rhomboid family intramembrane serine protease [Halococcoides sp.]